MRHNSLDRFSRLESPIHSLPAAFKAVTAVACVIVLVATPYPGWWLFGAMTVFLSGIVVVSGIPFKSFLSRLLLLEPFVIGAAVLSLFQQGGGAIFILLVVKSTLCLAAMVILSTTTPFSALLTLLRRLHIPALLVTTLALLYRYLFVLVEEAERMKRARASRTFSKERRRRWFALASIIGQLSIRSMERSQRIYAAMQARGWQ